MTNRELKRNESLYFYYWIMPTNFLLLEILRVRGIVKNSNVDSFVKLISVSPPPVINRRSRIIDSYGFAFKSEIAIIHDERNHAGVIQINAWSEVGLEMKNCSIFSNVSFTNEKSCVVRLCIVYLFQFSGRPLLLKSIICVCSIVH